LKLVFMGTPEFAVSSLEMLIESEHEIAAVVTQPDRPRGRGLKLRASPVKELATGHGIRVLQPEKAREPAFIEDMRRIAPEAMVVVAFGQILPRELLEIPPHGCINVHASLLPLYRGAAPINWAIINGERETGVTTMLMDEGMDTGDILLQRSILINPDDTAGSLHDKLAPLGARLLMETLFLLKEGMLKPEKQDNQQASYAPSMKKDNGRINWSLSAEMILNRIRGLNPWPGAFTEYRGNSLKILSADAAHGKGQPGEILAVDRDTILVACGLDAIQVLEVQPSGKRKMTAPEFLRGHRIKQGDFFER
jgi:methionyl-tRNA formyltransferase